MNKEFNLSSEIANFIQEPEGAIAVSKVKEFISKLKEATGLFEGKSEEYKDGWCDGIRFMFNRIDKLAGWKFTDLKPKKKGWGRSYGY